MCMAVIVMACTFAPYIAVAHTVMAHIVIANIVRFIAMTYIAFACTFRPA